MKYVKRIWFTITYVAVISIWVITGIWTGEADEDSWNPFDGFLGGK